MATALFFGSFNPIHVGHLIIAETMLGRDDVEEVWLVVSPQNPLKESGDLMSDRTRLALAEAAVEGNGGLKVCDIEMTLPRPSYTWTTLQALRERYPQREFVIVMGSDNLALFDRWRNHEAILESYRLLVYPRRGSADCPLRSHPHVEMVEVPMMDISSTLVRQHMRAGRSIRYLVTEPVRKRLEALGFNR